MQRRVSNILSRLRRVADKPPTEMLPYPQIFSFNLETHILSPENPLEDPTRPLLSGSQCSVCFSQYQKHSMSRHTVSLQRSTAGCRFLSADGGTDLFFDLRLLPVS